jgi:hypothetical protein
MLDTVLTAAERWRDHGFVEQTDGTRCFGAVPKIGPLAWLYVIYPPLEEPAFPVLEQQLGRPVDEQYRAVLEQCNGLNLVADSLSLDGLVTEYNRSALMRQPYDLVVPNVDERPADADDQAFFIGGYGRDGSLLYLGAEGSVTRCSRDSALPLNNWPSLADMLAG